MAIRHARLVTALLTTTAIGLGAIEIQTNLAARATVKQLLLAHRGLAVGSVFAEPLTGRLTLHGVRAGSEALHITIGTLDLPLPRQGLASPGLGLIDSAAASPFDDKPDEAKPDEAKPDEPKPDAAEPDAAAAAPKTEVPATSTGTASAEDVVITSGTTTYRIKRIDMTGTSLSNADLASLVDPKSPDSLETKLKKLNAAAIVVPEILADDTTAGSERHATVRQILLSGATAGKIAAGSAAGVTFSIKTGDDDSLGSVGAIQASAVDLAQLAHVFGSVRTDDAEPISTLYDSITATTISITDKKKNSTLTLAALKETGAKARPLKTDYITASKAGSEKLTDDQKAAVYDDMTHSFEIGSIEATGLAGGGNDASTFSVASVSMKEFAKAKIGGFSLRAFRFDGPEVKMGVGTMDVGAFALPPPKGAAAISSTNPMVPSTAKVDVSQIDFDVTNTDKDKAGPPTHVQFKVAHVGFVSDGEPGELPKTSKTGIENLTFDLPPDASQAQPLLEMGYRHLDVSLGLATSYDPSAQALMIHDLTLNGAGMGSLALGLHLVNVTKGLVAQNQEVVKASALAILAKGLTLDLVNDGLIDRALVWKAKQDGLDVGKEKDFLIDFFATKLPASLNNSANVKLVGAALAKFVAEPKNLHIGIESKSGLGIGSMALLSDPGLLIDSLDVTAAANQ